MILRDDWTIAKNTNISNRTKNNDWQPTDDYRDDQKNIRQMEI